MTRKEAVEEARRRIGSVVWYGLDLGLPLDQQDHDNILETLELLTYALRHDTPK